MKINFLKRKTKSYLKNNKVLRSSMPYTQALNVGIIFSVESKQKHDLVKDFIKRLEHDGKKVNVVSYLPKQKENYEFMFDFFTDNDLTFWGNITAKNAISFSQTPFDYLFYLDTEPNPLILNLIAKSKAKCRIGKYNEISEPYFEMMIEGKVEAKTLIEEIYKYTTLLA